ncbi:hypothetical protein G6F53_011625 [Rhizopus delemar]|uniref:DDE-1 domain-containing protein n=2 Tax=Rhizopus TaxID=4842 RepID=A0A9P6YTR9_9FUNG|nr:hypothetical protein G6F53_011625 [Rhizopus delemar]KAG1534869.1 hypothetical protein G6F51_011848 [Rhizopus arrhizus]KAG1563779.1 hypothetical protein G6F50_011668 [Rhizopus delemar]
MNNNNLPVNRDSILRYVRYIAQVKYRIPEKEISFSSGWLTKLFKRIGVKCRPMHGESASVDISSENIQNELRKIEELLEPYDPADIMNFDEKGLYYQQPPRRTICSESLDGLKKSKARLTVGLLCNSDGSYKGHTVVIGQHKSPKCFKTRANLLSMTAIGKKHEVEYHYSTNAWMTNDIFIAYVKKLDVAFGRQNRKIALLLDNASVHKIKIPLNNIKLIFFLANTTSKLQALDAGIIANFKAHFRAQQYDHALCLYISKKLDNPNVYKMDQAQAMFFLANTWLKVKPETIKNCWQHTKILTFKEKTICDFEPVEYPTSALPLEAEIVAALNGMLPDIYVKFDNNVTDVSQLNLEADESEMIVYYKTSTNNEEMVEGNIDEAEENDNTEQDEQRVDIVECKKRLREAYEAIIIYKVPLDDLDRKLHRRIRMRLADSCAELNKSKEQTA